MLFVLSDINWLAVIAATIVFAVLGGVYFTAVVGKPYKVALGNENRELPKPGAIFIVGPLIASLLVVITTAILLRPSQSTRSAMPSSSDSSSQSATSSPRR